MWSVALINPSRLRTVRIAIAPLCLMAVVVSPLTYCFAVALGLLATVDCLLCRRLFAIKPTPVVIRDLVYALGFFVCYVTNPNVPALLVYVVPLVEVCICFGAAKGQKALLFGGLLLIVRVVTLATSGHAFPHPVWIIFMSLLLLVSFGLGILVRAMVQGKEELVLATSNFHLTMTNLVVTTYRKISNCENPELIGGDSFVEKVNQALVRPDACEEIASFLASKVNNTRSSQASPFTKRELEVMGLMHQGKSYATIAKELQVSEGTARAHGASILRKTGSHTRDQAIRWALDYKILTNDKYS